jgi:precorrin-2/cobalt-factor-2 C20-methyltransferase
MKFGTLYGIGIGPGDPELITVKGARILAGCRHVFVPKATMAAESVALSIIHRYLKPDSRIYEIVFPMTSNREELSQRWAESAQEIITVLQGGEDACFLTLGDPFLYSTYIYLLRELRARLPDMEVITVPGVTAFSAAAALTEFPIGEAKEPVTVIPTADDLEYVRRSLTTRGTIVLMKIGKRLGEILRLLEDAGVIDESVLVSHAGMEHQRVETNLRSLRGEGPEAGYLSIILVHTKGNKAR